MKHTAYFTCPNCGEEVKAGAKVCPHCGSDDETGWSANTAADGLDLYDEEDYQETLAREFGSSDKKMPVREIVLAVIAAIVVAAFLINYIF